MGVGPFDSGREARKRFAPPQQVKEKAPYGAISNLVAGAGIEPASGGYEPPEVPLLYPAMCILLFLWGASQLPSRLWEQLSSTPLCLSYLLENDFAIALPLGLPTPLYPAMKKVYSQIFLEATAFQKPENDSRCAARADDFRRRTKRYGGENQWDPQQSRLDYFLVSRLL